MCRSLSATSYSISKSSKPCTAVHRTTTGPPAATGTPKCDAACTTSKPVHVGTSIFSLCKPCRTNLTRRTSISTSSSVYSTAGSGCANAKSTAVFAALVPGSNKAFEYYGFRRPEGRNHSCQQNVF